MPVVRVPQTQVYLHIQFAMKQSWCIRAQLPSLRIGLR